MSENGQLEEQSYGAGSSTFTDIGGQALDYNAIGLDPQNDFIYAVGYGNGNSDDGALFRVDDTGTATDLGTITDPGHGGVAIGQQNNAAFDAAGDMYVYNFANGTTDTANDVLYKVSVATHTATTIKLLGPDVPTTSDFAFVGSDLWGYAYSSSATADFARIDPATGEVTLFPTTLDIPAADFMGAAWTYGNGNLGFEDDTNGVAYQVKITDPDSTAPSFGLVSQYAGPNEGGLDGAACAGDDVDLSLTKTGTTPVAPDSQGRSPSRSPTTGRVRAPATRSSTPCRRASPPSRTPMRGARSLATTWTAPRARLRTGPRTTSRSRRQHRQRRVAA